MGLLLLTLLPHLGVAVAAIAAGMLFEHWLDPGTKERMRPSDMTYAAVNVGLVTPLAIVMLSAVAPQVRLAVHPAVGLVIGFFVFELITYGLHRLWHASPTLMRFHRVHHSPHLSALVSFRMHPIEVLAYILLGNLPLVILGMPAWGGIYVLLAERTYNVLLHARVPFRLGIIGKVFASGAFHHRHHAAGRAANFGGVVSIYDHLFGTAAPELALDASTDDESPRTHPLTCADRSPDAVLGGSSMPGGAPRPTLE